jgi:hypothetical protein
MDALILSRIPVRIWQDCVAAVIEVWAVPEISERDVTDLLGKLQNFDYASWNPKSSIRIDLKETFEFSTSESRYSRNLFLSKTL